MNVLMFGWEFPPRVSGGLGTACEGIADALVREGARVTFVAPGTEEGASGSEARPETSAIPSPHPPRGLAPGDPLGGRSVARFPRFVSTPLPSRAFHRAAGRPSAPSPSPVAGAREALRILSIPSSLHPYATRATFDVAPGDEAETDAAYGGDLFTAIQRFTEDALAFVAREDFDLIHAHDWMTLPAGLTAREKSGRPLVWHVHSTEHDRNADAPDAAIRAIEQMGLDLADRVVAVSRYAADVLARHYRVDPRRLRIVHNAVRPRATRVRREQPSASVEQPLVLFLGRLTHQKDPFTFLRAAPLILEALPNARFVFAGSGDLFPELVDAARRLDLRRHVHFTGFLDGEDVERMFALADVYVMPSRSEPFGIAALEAMSADVPVVVTRDSGVAELFEHALKIPSGDERALADAVLSVLTRPELRRDLIEGARAEVALHRWEVRARALLDIYRELLP